MAALFQKDSQGAVASGIDNQTDKRNETQKKWRQIPSMWTDHTQSFYLATLFAQQQHFIFSCQDQKGSSITRTKAFKQSMNISVLTPGKTVPPGRKDHLLRPAALIYGSIEKIQTAPPRSCRKLEPDNPGNNQRHADQTSCVRRFSKKHDAEDNSPHGSNSDPDSIRCAYREGLHGQA